MSEITITLKVKELIYDVANKTYLTGRSREAEGSKNYEASSNMQASDDEENSYQIRRSLSNAFSSVKSALSEYLLDSSTSSDNLISEAIDEDGELELQFSMPSNFSTSSVSALGNSIHSYLVDIALADWFSITNKEDAETYIAHSALSLESAKRSLYKRKRPTRPNYNDVDADDAL